LSDFSTRPGAVGSPPEHYGNPLGEQRLLAAGAAVVELADRGVITVTGPDRLTWLDSLTSQALTGLRPGDSAETLLLDPHGHLQHAMRVIDDGETTWLLVDAAQTTALAAWLDRMRFMLRVEVADRSSEFVTIGTLGEVAVPADSAPDHASPADSAPTTHSGPAAPALPGPAAPTVPGPVDPAAPTLPIPAAAPHGIPLVWVDPWRAVVAGGHQYSTAERHPGLDWTYREILVSPDAALADLPVAGTLALEALRIAAWRPRLATEADDKTIPHELDWLRSAVHLAKGCYRGQETVAKVHNLGHPPRRLVMLHLDGSEGVLPAPGDSVLWDKPDRGEATDTATATASETGTATETAPATVAATAPATLAATAPATAAALTEVGHVTSAAIHYELGPIALAVIKRSVDPGATVIVRAADADLAAAQETIVPTDAGAEANVPRLPRLGAVRRGA
jgi:folate-binding protein YgfZ